MLTRLLFSYFYMHYKVSHVCIKSIEGKRLSDIKILAHKEATVLISWESDGVWRVFGLLQYKPVSRFDNVFPEWK